MKHAHKRLDNQRFDNRISLVFVALAILTLLAAAPTARHVRLTGSALE